MNTSQRRVTFIIGQEWIAGPVTFLRRASARLPDFGWMPRLLVTGQPVSSAMVDWPCPVSHLPLCHSYTHLGREAATRILQDHADVVVATMDNTSAVAFERLYRDQQCNVRLVRMLHADEPAEFARLEQLAPVVTAAFVINEWSVEEVRRLIPALRERVFRWYNPVTCPDHVPWPRLSNPVKLVYVGRVFQREKRVLDLIPIGEHLLARGMSYELTIVGDGESMEELQQRLAAAPEVNRRTRVTGWVSEGRVKEILQDQDLFLLPSEAESMSFALLEAMAHGVVPIVTPLPGPSEVVDESTGFRVRVGDHEAFAAAIAQAISGPERLQNMRLAAFERIRQHFELRVAIRSFASSLSTTIELELPDGRSGFRAPRPRGRMDALHIPDLLQHYKRRLFGQHITP